MKRPPFDRRLPLFLVMAGTFMVLLSLGSFNVSLRKMARDSEVSPPPAPGVSSPLEERKAAGLTWDLLVSLDHWQLRADLKDDRGIPVAGGRGHVVLAAAGAVGRVVALRETEPGRYVVDLPRALVRSGVTARVHIDKEESRIARVVQIAF